MELEVRNAQGEAVKVIGEYLPTLAAAGLGGPPSTSQSPSDTDAPASLSSSWSVSGISFAGSFSA